MDYNDFFWKVAQLRQAQKDYLALRKPEILRAAIRLEHEVDAEIDRVRATLKD